MSGGSNISILPEEIILEILKDSGIDTFKEFMALKLVSKLWKRTVEYILVTPHLMSLVLGNFSNIELIKMGRNPIIVGNFEEALVKEIDSRHIFNQIKFNLLRETNFREWKTKMKWLRDEDRSKDNTSTFPLFSPYNTYMYNNRPRKTKDDVIRRMSYVRKNEEEAEEPSAEEPSAEASASSSEAAAEEPVVNAVQKPTSRFTNFCGYNRR